jgi:hypothetical protein
MGVVAVEYLHGYMHSVARHLGVVSLAACRKPGSGVDARVYPRSLGRVWKFLKMIGPSVGELRRPTVCWCNGGISAGDGQVPSIIGSEVVRR